MLPETVKKSSNVLALTTEFNPVSYIAKFKFHSFEMDSLGQRFKHPKAGPILQYLCYLHDKFGCPANGISWPVMVPTRKSSHSIATKVGIKSETTLRPILNEIRVYLKFEAGIYLDPASIDFQGLPFAAYHNGRTNEVRWFANTKVLSELANSILKLAGHTQPINGEKDVKTDPKLVGNCAEIDPELTQDCAEIDVSLMQDCGQTDGSYYSIETETKTEAKSESEKETKGEIVKNQITTPLAFQAKQTVGEDKKTENQNTENMKTVVKVLSLEKEENLIKEEKTKPSSVYTIWKNLAETSYKQKGLPSNPDTKNQGSIRNLRTAFNREKVVFSLETLVEAAMVNWKDLRVVLDKQHNQFWAVNSDFPTLTNIYGSFSPILTWYIEEEKHIEEATKSAEQFQVLVAQKKAADLAKAEYEKANPTPKKNMKESHRDGYTYHGSMGLRYESNGKENFTHEQRYAEEVKEGLDIMLYAYVEALRKFSTNKQASYDRIISLLGDTPAPEGLKKALLS